MEELVLVCCASVEWLNSQNQTMKKIQYKSAMISIIRDPLKQMYLEIAQEKLTTTKLLLRDINVFKKFMSEGKASIKFNADKCSLFISNAPPGNLILFLKTLYIKMTKDNDDKKGVSKEDMHKKLREHLLSEKSSQFDKISPVTNAELDRAKKQAISKSSITTPSPPASKKRRLIDVKSTDNPKAAKQLYAPSPLSVKNNNQSESRSESLKNPNDPALIEILNMEQSNILDSCIAGRSVFFTGSAGTGKSFLLRKIISTLPPDGTVVCASTGVAACLIGGVTLHSFAGIGAGDHSLKRSVEMASRPASAQTWRKCKRLIIDEISMVDSTFFDLIEGVAREIRRNEKPFGGIQLILCGDFFQLPPVLKIESRNIFDAKKQPSRFCFQSKAWQSCIQFMFELKQIYRQKDPKFVEILNSIRIGRVTPEMSERLLATSRQKIDSNGILATQLCSHTKDADSINQSKLESLKSPEKIFESTDSDPYLSKTLDSQLPVPHKLVLKVGAQVMLLKNINLSTGLVNGARGVILKYSEGFPVVQFKNKTEYIAKPEKWIIKTPSGVMMQRKQVPLKLAWAFSIHKSQGLTLDCLEMSLSKVFEAGQAYVALSRAQSLDSLRILDFDARQVYADPVVLQFYKDFRRKIADPTTYIKLGVRKEKTKSNGSRLMSKRMMSEPLMIIN